MFSTLEAYRRSIPSTHVRSLFFFNDTATTEIYTLSLHDALPIFEELQHHQVCVATHSSHPLSRARRAGLEQVAKERSEEHTSELQSRLHLVCRLLLEKKKKIYKIQDFYRIMVP